MENLIFGAFATLDGYREGDAANLGRTVYDRCTVVALCSAKAQNPACTVALLTNAPVPEPFAAQLKNGGVEAIQKVNEEKAAILYDCIDNSSLYTGTVTNKAQRSLMNVPFVLPNEELTAKFIKESTAAGLVSLKGHRSVGGIRASIYNAMPIEGVEYLIDFMKKFAAENK